MASASFHCQVVYTAALPLLQLYFVTGGTVQATAPRIFLAGLGALLANIKHGGPWGLEADCEETGPDAVALATMLQTCLDSRPLNTVGASILGRDPQPRS